MSNVLMAYPNRAGGAVSYSGPAWSSTLPLANLAARQITKAARSLTADKRMAWWHMAGAASFDVGVVALARHNLGTAGKVRVRGFATDPRPATVSVFVAAQLPSNATFTRSTVGNYIGADGLLKQAAINTPRWEYSGAACQGLLMEGPSTNQIKYSRDPSNAAWTHPNMTLAATTGIDGVASSAMRLTAGAANARINQTGMAWDGNNPVCGSLYARRITGTGAVRISLDGFATSTVITLTTAWQRFYITGSGATQFGVQVDVVNDVIEVDCAQVEDGWNQPSSPIHTTSAAVARGGETLSLADTNGTQAAGALVLAGKLKSRPVVGTASLLGGGQAEIQMTTAGAVTGIYAAQASIGVGTLSPGDAMTVALSFATNDVRGAMNGAAGTPDTVATMTTTAFGALVLYANVAGLAYVAADARHYAAAFGAADVLNLSGADVEIVPGYDSGLVDAWPASWVSGTTAEKRAGVPSCTLVQPGATQTWQYWRVDLVDEANADGFVQCGRVFMGTAWQPTVNMSYGAGLSYLARELITESFSGAEYFTRRPNPRLARFSLENIAVAEAWGDVFEMQRQLGTTEELLFSWNPADLAQQPRHTFLGRLRTLNALEMPYINTEMQTGIEVKELL